MRKLLSLLMLIAALPVAWYQYDSNKAGLRAAFGLIKAKVAPCRSAVRYSVGYIDQRFGLTPEELLSALKEAEALWEGPAGRDLFEYAPQGGDVPVDMVYDNRQYSLDKLKALGHKTDQSLASYENLKQAYDSLSVSVKAAQDSLASGIAAYKAREGRHNAEILAWNSRGSIPPAARRRVDAEKHSLQAEFSRLKTTEAGVNGNVDTLNAMASTLNLLITQLNVDAGQYSREGSLMGRYEEGLYRSAGGRQKIELYAYTGREQLVGLLAHELGHAVGMDHVADKDSVMHLINAGSVLKVTAADLAELNKACTPSFRRRSDK